MSSIYFNIPQVIELMFLFPEVHYLRVQLICTLFSHITDIENIGDVVDLLSLDERDEVCGRRLRYYYYFKILCD